jgi:hypothetical protein
MLRTIWLSKEIQIHMSENAEALSRLERLKFAFEQNRASQVAERLALQLSSLSDPTLRLYSFGQKLREMPAKEGAMILDQICRRREEGALLFEGTHLQLLAKEALREVLGEAKISSLIRELRFLGLEDTLRYLTNDPPNLRFERDHAEDRRPLENLGTRISLARKTTPRIIEKLLHDPNDRVIQTMLGNPRLTEAEVLKISSSPRTSPSILATIAHHERWICRYKVKLSLSYNPNTPLRVSLGLLPFLMRQDLAEIADDQALPAPVREKAERLLKRKRANEMAVLREEG